MKLIIEVEIPDYKQEEIFENTVLIERAKKVKKDYDGALISETMQALDAHFDTQTDEMTAFRRILDGHRYCPDIKIRVEI